MSQSHRGQFGTGSLLALLALTAGSVVAETLPPLRINSALLGAGTLPPPTVPSAPEPLVAAKPLAASPVQIEPAPTAPVELTPQQARPAVEATPQPATPAARAAPAATPTAPVAKSVAATTAPTSLPQAAATEMPGRQQAATETIQKPQEPPQVEERPVLPALYSAYVAAGVLPEPKLKRATGIIPYLKRPGDLLPNFITADQIAGKTDVEVVAEGNVELRKRNSVLLSDRLTYWQEADEAEAEGNVRLSRDGDRIRGPKMRMKMEDSTGFFEQPEYSIRRIKTGSAATLWTGDEERVSSSLTTGQGAATHLEFEGEGKYRLTDATYTTCTPAAGHDPDWFARTTNLHLDYDEEVGTARNATLYFMGTPVLYSPWVSFSLNNERKSGLLTPTFGTTSRGGMEYTQPFYWNMAPNMDATIAPRIMAKRGTLWNGEYRYLEPTYAGIMQGQFLAEDKITQTRRSSYSIIHNQNFGGGFSGSLNVNGASDGTFFSDLANGSSVIAQTNLLREGTLSYAGGWWSANLLTQSYQTLQDPSLPPVTDPYQRLPQLTVSANRRDLPLGLAGAFSSEYVNFKNPTPGMEQARRLTLYPQLSLPLSTAAFNVTPKIGLHYTSYTRDQQPAGSPEKLTRSVPIFSVDSGVALERDLDWFGHKATQTLEPRLKYLYVPVRDQSQFPVFDSGANGFDLSQIFSENRYGGGDRIGDANQVTATITSRLVDINGAETARATLGQLIYLSTQKVGLPGEVLRSDRQTDYLGAFAVTIQPNKIYATSDLQYNPRLNQLERFNIGGRYQPEPGKLVNVDYRYTRDLLLGQPGLGQIDISGQWPVFGGWHAVGRFNYSTMDRRMIESVAGMEYDGGCWVGRVVFQRLATQTQQSNTALFFQLELNGFAKVGSNPLDILRRSVPGYGVINQQTSDIPLTIP
jgi:LPS-assembly protein